LGDVGDNFGAGMTGGMGFVYDPENIFQNKANPETIVWQKIETKFWINSLKVLVKKHFDETKSEVSRKIIENFETEVYKFYQVCPKEMLDKLESPITNKKTDIAS
jgi:glutamate synthase (NADPH/NADH) large chain